MPESIRETIEAAMAAQSGDPAPEASSAAPPAPAETAPAGEPSQSVSGRQRDESGRFSPSKESAPAAKTEVAPGKTEPAATEERPPAPPVAQAKAPQSWKATARELAARLPAEFHPLLEEAHRREKETAVALQRAAEVSRAHQGFQESTRPYEAMIRQSGATPEQYVGSLLQAAHTLSYGQPAQRADALAGIVAQFASDLLRPDRHGEDGTPSSPLDRALVARMSGQGSSVPRSAPQAQEFRDSRLDALFAQARERAVQVGASRAEELIGKHEFLVDLRDDVADILELWGGRGNKNPSDADVERAYDIACKANPEIAKILEGRKSAEASRAKAPTVRAAKVAAVSVKDSPGVAQPRGTKGMTIRETIEAAMAQHM